MHKFWISLGAGALALSLGGAAFAQQPQADAPQAREQVTEYNFGEDKITGEFKHHGGQLVQGELARQSSSLVSPRANFLPELIKSAEDL